MTDSELKLDKLEWDFSQVLQDSSEENVEKIKEEIQGKIEEFKAKWEDNDEYLEEPEVLKEALDDFECLMSNCGSSGELGYYFSLRTFVDNNNPEILAKYNKISEFGTDNAAKFRFFTNKLSKVDEEKKKLFLESEDLVGYRHFLRRLFDSSKHILSVEEERIMSKKSKTSYDNWVDMVEKFLSGESVKVLDVDGSKKEKSFEEIMSLTHSSDKNVRDDAFSAMNSILGKYKELAEVELNSVLESKKDNDSIRGYERPDSARHLGDDIDTEVVDSLLKAVSEKNDIAKRFYELKARLLGVERLEYHERNVPYGKIDLSYEFEDAAKDVYRVFCDLDEEFGEIYKRLFENGQVDVLPKKGKRGGACCINNLKTLPTYVLLNFTKKFRDLETLAHEMGHAINNELMKKQNSLNFGNGKATAEVASTFMEDFVLEDFLKRNEDDEVRLAVMMNKLNGDISSIFRQIACYRFEQELHEKFREKGYLSHEEIGEIFKRHMESYMGEFVEQSKGCENWWVYWSHIRYFFYVYSYASGLLISKALQSKVREDKRVVENVKDFLGSGRSNSPKNVFLKMDIDITKKEFWGSGLDEVENLLNEAWKLAERLGKI